MATGSSQYELKELTETDITTPIPLPILTRALTSDPFISIAGITNLRDLGLLPSSPIRPGLIYRSGVLHSLPPTSLTKLKNLGIKLILDLRTEREIARSPNPVIEGVENLHFDSLRVPTPVDLNKFAEEGGTKGYVEIYEEVLEIHKPSIKVALEWVRDEKGPILFHCTAGKDRTGVLAAVILSLAGAPKDLVAYDYTLTRIGVEPARELLLQMLKMWNKDWTPDTPGMHEFSSIKPVFMLGTLKMMEEKYGGVEGYVKGLGFGDEDVRKIRRVLKGE